MVRIIIFLTIVASMMAVTRGATAAPPTLRYFCQFKLSASLDGLEKVDDFTLEFILETATGKGMLIGNNGFSEVLVTSGSYGITFLELLKTGAVQSTTIVNGTFSAVHSRHTILLGNDLLPSQYYGECKVVKGKGLFE